MELLEAREGNVLTAFGFAVLDKRGVHLAGAKDDARDLVVRFDLTGLVCRVGDDPTEVGIAGELLNVGARERMAEETLAEEQDERWCSLALVCKYAWKKLTFPELSVHLPSENVEQVRGLGEVGNLHVCILMLSVELVRRREDAGILVAELQVSLYPARRVLRALTVVSMGQVQDETGTLEPLRLARRNELIDDALGVVGEIAELSLPHDEGVGRRQ